MNEFKEERESLNELVMKYAKKNMKRFYNLDENVYNDGALERKTKELLGLVSSLVLRCDDCVEYHLITSHRLGITSAELEEALSVGLIIGGSIVIPHLRRAFRVWEELEDEMFNKLKKEVKNILSNDEEKERRLKKVCRLLREEVSRYDWVGFYFIRDGKLILGPFDGEPTEHVKIEIGEGICGQAAESMKTFIVADVSKEKNYLSCSPKVKAEIVVPIFKNGEIVGEIDIDSHKKDPFTKKDEMFLSNVCEMVSKIL